MLQDFLDDIDNSLLDDDRAQSDAGLIADPPTLKELQYIAKRTVSCLRDGASEPRWNNEVHALILSLASRSLDECVSEAVDWQSV